MIAQPAEPSARERRMAEALVRHIEALDRWNASVEDIIGRQPATGIPRDPSIEAEARAVLASPEAPRGSLADACAELARLQEPVAPEIQATLDSLPVLDLASAAPETPAKAWIEVRSGPLRRASAHLVTLNPHGVSGQTYEAHIVSALENPGYVSRIANEWAAALGLEVRR